MKILVTGASGFIGPYVIAELLEKGHQVVATSLHPEKARAFEWFNKVSYKPFDISLFDDTIDHYAFFERPDILIHLAWEGLPNYKQAFHLERNLPAHSAFLANLFRNGLKDLTVTGTCFEYGMQEGCLREDMAVFPANPYAMAKNELRKNIEAMIKGSGISFKWVRLFYMYGAGQSPGSLLSQLDKALDEGAEVFNMSGGEQERDFLPATEVASCLAAIATQKAISGIINCCSGVPVKVRELVEEHLAKKGKRIKLNLGYYPYPDYEPMRFWGDRTLLNQIMKRS